MSLAQQSPFMNRFLYSFLPSLHSNIKVGLNHEQAQNTKTTSRTTHSLEFTTRTLHFFFFLLKGENN